MPRCHRLLSTLPRCAALPLATVALAATARPAFAWPPPTADPLAGVAAAAAAGAWLIGAWLALATITAATGRLPGRLGRMARRIARRVTPAAARHVVAALSGAALAGTAVTPAFAAGTAAVPPVTLPVPTEPADAGPVPPLGEPATVPVSHVRIVRPGDSLWSIAAASLGDGATPTAVAAAWPRWWAANRAVIGADPAVLRPGQRLQAPAR